MRLYNYFSLILEGRQIDIWETGCLPAKEVVRNILDADFPKCELELYDKESNVCFDYEYDKLPLDGKFLLKVTRKTDNLSLRVFIDTRTNPNYIWIEKLQRNDLDTINKQILNAVKNALGSKVYKAGWEIKTRKFVSGEPKDEDLFFSAQKYACDDDREIKVNKEAFRSVVIADLVADAVLKWILIYMKGKTKPLAIIAPLKAANMAGAIHKLTKTTFQEIFGDLLGNSVSLVDRYMSDAYEWNPNDKLFEKMVMTFAHIVKKIMPLMK